MLEMYRKKEEEEEEEREREREKETETISGGGLVAGVLFLIFSDAMLAADVRRRFRFPVQ